MQEQYIDNQGTKTSFIPNQEIIERNKNVLPDLGFVKKIEPEYFSIDELEVNNIKENSKIKIQATVEATRKQGWVSFVTIKGSTLENSLQVVVETPKGEMREMFKELNIRKGSVIRIEGVLASKPKEMIREDNNENILNAYELMSKPTDIVLISQPEIQNDYFKWCDVMKGHLTQEDYGEILRMPEFRRIMDMRDSIKKTFLEHFNKKGFHTIDVPSLTGSISESGAEVFKVNSRAGELALIQSPQQIKQIMAGFLEKVVWTGQAFRNDPSVTSHHLAEFTGMDIEMQTKNKDKRESMMSVMYELQESVKSIVDNMSKNTKCFEENNTKPPLILENGIPVITFLEAIKIATTNEFNRDAEKAVADYILNQTGSEFYFVTDFPEEEKPFYTDLVEENPKYTYSFDLIYRGVEISSGGLRINDVNILKERLIKKGFDPENFITYLDSFKRGTAQTGGFGLGLERFIANSLGGLNVRLTTPFPKTSDLILG